MKASYSEAFIEQALIKMYTRGTRTIQSVAEELNLNYHTVRTWMKRKAANRPPVTEIKEKRPQDWSAEERLVALQETHSLSSDALQAWCRERGLFTHHLTSWKTAFCTVLTASPVPREWRTWKDENAKLKRDLIRKEKALAEAAALLILQKKFQALWEDEDK